MSRRRERARTQVVVGMAGTEGLAYGRRLLEVLRASTVEAHLVMTRATEEALGDDLPHVRALAPHVYANDNQAARISSGSFLARGMVVAPCDGASFDAIRLGLATNLVFRAADVTLKEHRPLVLGLAGPGPAETAEHVASAEGVPGLLVVPLEGPADEAVAALVDLLGAGADRPREP